MFCFLIKIKWVLWQDIWIQLLNLSCYLKHPYLFEVLECIMWSWLVSCKLIYHSLFNEKERNSIGIISYSIFTRNKIFKTFKLGSIHKQNNQVQNLLLLLFRTHAFLIHGSNLFLQRMFWIITPTIIPPPYPNPIAIQWSLWKRDFILSSSFPSKIEPVSVDFVRSSHLFDNGSPHNPAFPTYELFSNVLSWFPRGIRPSKRLWETLKNERKVSSTKL